MAAPQAFEPHLNPHPFMATDALAAAPTSRRLKTLRGRLDAVRRRRLLGRRLTAWAAVAVAVLAALLVALAVDRLFGLSRAGRIWLWAGIAATVVWAFRKHAWPLLKVRESDLDVALSMEKSHGIDSDFVAALQFEWPEAQGWGSATLRSAVVDYVSEFGREWTSVTPLWNKLLAGRTAWAAGLAGLLVAIGIASPGTLAAFVNRMALGTGHYPTWTRLERLAIGGREIDPRVGGDIPAPAGQPLSIEVAWSGRTPGEGRADFTPDAGGPSASVPLAAPAQTDPAAGPPTLAGELPNLTESATVVIHAGDAWSEPVRIRAVPAPIVEASLRVVPPAYARGSGPQAATGRQAAVLEGSAVEIDVVCLNKELERVAVVIDGTAHPLAKESTPDGRPRFVLSGPGSPLAAVTAPVQYEVQAVDTDGLAPDSPPAGTIRIRPDGPPQVTIEALTRAVLPTARPSIAYTVKDDHGVAGLRATIEITRGDEPDRPAPDATAPAAPAATARVVELLGGSAEPLVGAALPHAGRVVLPLADYGLRKGDFLRVAVEAVDYRGAAPGQRSASAPIDLVVTDENGVLESLQRSDTQAAQELQTIIEDQLRVGDKP
jgi:hypothetical protein